MLRILLRVMCWQPLLSRVSLVSSTYYNFYYTVFAVCRNMFLVLFSPCLFIHLWEQDAENLAGSDVLATSPLQDFTCAGHRCVFNLCLCIIYFFNDCSIVLILVWSFLTTFFLCKMDPCILDWLLYRILWVWYYVNVLYVFIKFLSNVCFIMCFLIFVKRLVIFWC